MALTRAERLARNRAKDPEKANIYLREWRKKDKEQKMINLKIKILRLLINYQHGLRIQKIAEDTSTSIASVISAINQLLNDDEFIEKNNQQCYLITETGINWLEDDQAQKLIVDKEPEPLKQPLAKVKKKQNEPKNDTNLDQAFIQLNEKLFPKKTKNVELKIDVLQRLAPLLDKSIADILTLIIKEDLNQT